MKTEDYKKRFIALFQEMEKDLDKCQSVEIDRDQDIVYGGEIVDSHYTCKIRF